MKQEYITRSQFKVIKKYLINKKGRSWEHDPFLMFNAVLYVLIGGVQWRLLPESFPPYKTVFYHFSKWKRDKVFHLILASLTKQQDNRLLIIDNQSISDSDLPSSNGKGYDGIPENAFAFAWVPYDGHKKRKGRKRCLLTDNKGNIHCVRYFPANYHDTTCAKQIIEYYRETPLGKKSGLVTLYGDKGTHGNCEVVPRDPEIKASLHQR